MKSQKKHSEKMSTVPVRLKALPDMARNVSLYGDVIRPLLALKVGDTYRLMSLHVKLDDSRLLLYAESKKIGECLVYQPKSDSEGEIIEFRAQQPSGPQTSNLQCIPIMELEKSPFSEKNAPLKISCICVKETQQLIKAIISRAMEHDTVGKVYVFKHKSNYYAGAFGLIDDEDIRGFTYAKLDSERDYGFFRYNYSTDKVELTDSFGDPSYIYVRVINLSEPFKFFKPE